METVTDSKKRGSKPPAFRTDDALSQAGTGQTATSCDYCHEDKEMDPDHRFDGLLLCLNCHRHLHDMPEYTRLRVQRFLIGNVV